MLEAANGLRFCFGGVMRRHEDRLLQYLNKGLHFVKREGRPPSMLDWRGENRRYWSGKHGVQYPSTRQVELVFGTWGNFLSALGEVPGYHSSRIGYKAMDFCREQFGVEVLTFHTGAVDGYWNGEPVEIKGATLEQDAKFGHYRWRFRLHKRKYSKLVSHMFFVGFSPDERPLVAWRFDKPDLPLFDDRDSVNIAAHTVLLNKPYPYVYNEVWKAQLTYNEVFDLLNGVLSVPHRTLPRKEAR